jgi:hypothetical protein
VRAELAPAVADGRLDIVGEAGDVDEAVAVVAHTGRMSSCSTSICRAGRSVRAGARC